jgi:hypothetical protein
LPSPLISEDNAQKALDDYDAFKALSDEVRRSCNDWTETVSELLKETPIFHFQFDDPDEMGYLYGKCGFKNIPPQIRNIEYKISETQMRVFALKKIITEIGKNLQQVNQSETKYIEPPVFKRSTQTLYFAGKAIRFNKNAKYSPILCDTILSEPTKLWALKDLLKYWNASDYFAGMNLPNDWQKVHQAIKRLNKRVEDATEIDDLFDFSTTSVRANPAYLKQSKK